MERGFSIKEYFNILSRRKWYFIIPLGIVVSISSVITLMLPKIYSCKTTILVEVRGASPIKGVFEPESLDQGRIELISKILKSRTKVEELIKELGLEQTVDGPEAYEVLVNDIQNAISLKSNKKLKLITIGFWGKDPHIAMRIVNTLTDYFINQNNALMYGTSDASAVPVLQELAGYYERRVNTARGVMTKFELEHQGQRFGSTTGKRGQASPNFENKNFKLIEETQLTLAETAVTIREETEKKRLLEERLAGNEEILPDFEFVQKELTPGERELNTLYAERDSLMTKYTQRHPEIIRIKSKIDTLRRKILVYYRQEGADPYAEEVVNMQRISLSPQYLKLRKILNATNMNLEELQKRKEKLINKVQQLNERVRMAPRYQQEYAALKRDLNVNQKIYDSLMGKIEKARLAKEIDAMQKSDRFAVITPAKLPVNPISPEVGKNILIGSIVGVLMGTAFAMWAEVNDHSLRDLIDAKDFLSIPILSTIPTVSTHEEITKKRRINMLITVTGAFYGFFITLLIAREIIVLYSPNLLYLQTYKEWFYQLSGYFNL